MKLYVLIFILLGFKSYALPTLYPDRVSFVKNSTNSSYLADSTLQNKFYVLPPQKAEAKVQKLHTINANIGFCAELAKIQKFNLDTLELLNSMKSRDQESQKYIDNLNQKLVHNRNLLIKLPDNSSEKELLKNEIQSIQSGIIEAIKYKRELQSEIRELYYDFLKMYDGHSKREGGKVSIEYDSKWDENLTRLQLDNPHFHFEKISTKKAVLRTNAYSKNNLAPDSAILSYDISGNSINGALLLESYPEAFNANLGLSLLGVCPLLHPQMFGIYRPYTLSDLKFSLLVGFEYPVSMKYSVKITYNLYRLYENIKSYGKSGGFLSTRTWSDENEKEVFDDAFEVQWQFQDERQLITEAQKQNIESDLRKQILTRLTKYLIEKDPVAASQLELNTAQTGALVLSNSLAKACPAHIYCVGASLALNVLQAIFGTAISDQNFKSELNITSKEVYSNEQTLLQPMLTSYR